ncbi:hypothetical protein AMAG_10742 [Allomyces macrogynus ATCC 38327]|uniref:Uncharacterized protein n=2 Tax=Allomyces macrogynus (strain ATCC 38327) TaxID=578462 RepID=A0A0L0SRF1_ALLM3|nr:hypothetical protein AMAG_10742 [Allomyces macrogynus ATCC 38327]|eukprot:KNE65082.1 hypothetical protein AMAG_10742 [Allomyces macrogynus ATCC 38327]
MISKLLPRPLLHPRRSTTALPVNHFAPELLATMGNGSKAQQKRERNAKAAGGVAKSQLKVNEAAKNIQCVVCKQTFLGTANLATLNQHAENKHNKTAADCFPGKA